MTVKELRDAIDLLYATVGASGAIDGVTKEDLDESEVIVRILQDESIGGLTSAEMDYDHGDRLALVLDGSR